MVMSRIAARVDELERRTDTATRTRVRNVLAGGLTALTEMLGETKARSIGLDMPAANFLYSGMERLAQKLRHPPTLKVDPVGRQSTEDLARERGDTLEAIVRGYDHAQKLDAQLGWNGRWLPVYSIGAWTMTLNKNGTPIGHLVDPFDLYPGSYGPNHDPQDLAVIRKIRVDALQGLYPDHAEKITGRAEDMVKVAEYHDETGLTVLAHELNLELKHVPNPVPDSLPFVVTPVPGVLATPQGQYDQAIGLLAYMVELNVETLIAIHDDVHAPYFIMGELLAGKIDRGRFGVNEVSQGGAVQRGTQSNVFPAQNQMSVLERQLRLVSGYPVIDDTISPNSFATGAGMSELRSDGVDNIVSEYRDITARGLAELDTLRLQWDEALYPEEERTLRTSVEGESRIFNYTPGKAINGAYMTRREFGPMAGWDDPQKILVGDRLLANGIIDKETYQEALHRMPAIGRTNERITRDQATEVMSGTLYQAASAGDPLAKAAVNEIRKNPQKYGKIMDAYLEAEAQRAQQQAQAEQQAAAAQAQGGAGPSIGGALTRAQTPQVPVEAAV